MCQLNPRERLADLAGDHLGDVFCQLKIKKSIPRPSKGSRKGLRGHAGREVVEKRARPSLYGGWLRRDFLPITHYFPLWSVVRSARARTYISVSFTYINSTFPYFIFSIFFAPHSVAPAEQGRFLQTLQWPLRSVAPSHLKVVVLDVAIIVGENWPSWKFIPRREFYHGHRETCSNQNLCSFNDLPFL